jgi:hypothetical protein
MGQNVRAIVEAKAKRHEEERSARVLKAEAIIIGMRHAIERWESDESDRVEGILSLEGISSEIKIYEDLLRSEALYALGAPAREDKGYTRDERQQLVGSRMYGLPFGERE